MLNPVQAPPATPPRYSLIVAAQVLDTPDRWTGGVSWESEQCGAGGSMEADCPPVTTRALPERPGRERANPFYVWASDSCSTMGSTQRDWQGRARRQLEATQSFQIARELWDGTITQAVDPSDERSPFLTDAATTVVEDDMAAQDAIAMAEAAAMTCSQGRRVMVHVPLLVLSAAMHTSPYLSVGAGGVITTAMGNIVVADAGYPGTPPSVAAGDPNLWVIATSLVQLRLDAVELVPGTLADARSLAQAVNRATNDAAVWAQRLVLYQLEQCCRVAVQTNIARPTSDPFPFPSS